MYMYSLNVLPTVISLDVILYIFSILKLCYIIFTDFCGTCIDVYWTQLT